MLGKHVPTNAQPTIEGHPLLGNGPLNSSRGNEYATIGEAVFSVSTCFARCYAARTKHAAII
jgi:hypothetical protein